MKWTDYVSEVKEGSPEWQLKIHVLSIASLHYKNKSPKDAANLIYSSLGKDWIKISDKYYRSYDEDGGDEAVKVFTKWIKDDRS